MTASRRRGRPSAEDTADRRAAIVQAARRRFAEVGFAAASVRSIAADAGVHPSLIAHYFGAKENLLVAALELPVNPVDKLAEVADGDVGTFGERLVRTFVSTWDPHREVFRAQVMSIVATSTPERTPIAQLARAVLARAVAARLDGPDVEVRAGLIATQVVGLGISRYVVEIPGVTDADADTVARIYGPAIQAIIDNDRQPVRPSPGRRP